MKYLRSYSIGFVLSLIITLLAYGVVMNGVFTATLTIVAVVVLAVAQLAVQMFFFLHLGDEARPRWKLLTFITMAMILLLIVFGSIWIMNNLNYNNMTPQQTDARLLEEKNKGF